MNELRALIAARHGLGWKNPPALGRRLSTGIPTLDALLGGGFVSGRLYECITGGSGSGSATLATAIIREMGAQRQWTALIDGADSFDPTQLGYASSRMLWVRCQAAAQAIKAADLLLRDRNLELIILDLAFNPGPQLNKIPASTWFRFQRLMEKSPTKMLVLTTRRLISSMRTSFSVQQRSGLEALGLEEKDLLSRLQLKVSPHWYEHNKMARQPAQVDNDALRSRSAESARTGPRWRASCNLL